MAAFLDSQLQTIADKVVLVGTDSPTLPLPLIAQAFRELDAANVVLGPAADGGYYLVGCKGTVPPMFDGVAWGTASVLRDTVGRLNDPDWKLALLPPWYDVDTPADWDLLRGHVAAMRRAGIPPGLPHTEALIDEG
jgi:glycosyltransferase A (GT-A) superfamily protein (DUF2064 family)